MQNSLFVIYDRRGPVVIDVDFSISFAHKYDERWLGDERGSETEQRKIEQKMKRKKPWTNKQTNRRQMKKENEHIRRVKVSRVNSCLLAIHPDTPPQSSQPLDISSTWFGYVIRLWRCADHSIAWIRPIAIRLNITETSANRPHCVSHAPWRTHSMAVTKSRASLLTSLILWCVPGARCPVPTLLLNKMIRYFSPIH